MSPGGYFKFLGLSFPHLENGEGNINSMCSIEGLEGLNRIIYVKQLRAYLLVQNEGSAIGGDN